MPSLFVTIGSAALAVGLLALAWTAQRRRGCNVASDSEEDAVATMLPPI